MEQQLKLNLVTIKYLQKNRKNGHFLYPKEYTFLTPYEYQRGQVLNVVNRHQKLKAKVVVVKDTVEAPADSEHKRLYCVPSAKWEWDFDHNKRVQREDYHPLTKEDPNETHESK